VDLKATVGDTPVSLQREDVRIDPFVKPAGAKPLATVGDVPVLLVNQVGQGRAVLLNVGLPGAARGAKGEASLPYGLVKALYRLGGAKPPITVTSADGGPLPSGEARVWQNAEATMFGVWHELNVHFFAKDKTLDTAPDLDVKAVLPKSLYVYDLRRRKSLGQVTEVRTRVAASQANFFLATPYAIGKPVVRVSTDRPKRGSTLRVSISLGLPAGAKANHAVAVDVLDRMGKPTLWGKQTVILPGGRGQVDIPIAHNDAQGVWHVRVEELFTGRSVRTMWMPR